MKTIVSNWRNKVPSESSKELHDWTPFCVCSKCKANPPTQVLTKPETLIERVTFLEERISQLEHVVIDYFGIMPPTWTPKPVVIWYKSLPPITEEIAKKGVIE